MTEKQRKEEAELLLSTLRDLADAEAEDKCGYSATWVVEEFLKHYEDLIEQERG